MHVEATNHRSARLCLQCGPRESEIDVLELVTKAGLNEVAVQRQTDGRGRLRARACAACGGRRPGEEGQSDECRPGMLRS
jgi:hypothetical protein